jgi:molybdopterin-guanine dinucleotide biosynthesis protein A
VPAADAREGEERVAGVLLSGGASRRLGEPKAELLRDGERLADRAARVLTAVCDPVVEVGPGYSSLRVVREDPPGDGPLAGFAAASAALTAMGHHGPVIVLAVDLPFVEIPLLAWLAAQSGSASVVPRIAGVAQSLCARYSPEARVDALALVGAREQSMRALLAKTPVDYVNEEMLRGVADTRSFNDVDTADDVAAAGLERPTPPGQ